MAVTRSSLIARASAGWAAASQVIWNRYFTAKALLRLLPRHLEPPPPRWTSATGANRELGALARPLHFPQGGRGRVHVDHLPDVGSAAFARLLMRARRASEVILQPTVGADPTAALGVTTMAAAGAPIRVQPTGSTGPTGVVDELAAIAGDPTRSQHSRELHSVRVRRVGHDRLWGGLRPSVSVLLATRRPESLAFAIEQMLAQRDADVQIVVGLHGVPWPDHHEDLRRRVPGGTIIERFDQSTSLGAVLDALARHADADLVTKWDDDDWYGRDHVADLVRAHRYSGADLIGKAAEFVWLEASGITMRRFSRGAESYSSTLAGGTMLMSRSWLEHVGGWPDVRDRVDRALLDVAARHHARSYRTHGFQYLLRRSATEQHTWLAPDEHFLDVATEVREGLDLEFADIALDPDGPVD